MHPSRQHALAAMLLMCVAAHGRPTRQFDQTTSMWYPLLRDLIENQCRVDYENYQNGEPADTTQRARVSVLIDCILTHMSDFHKVNMAASSIVLGSAPMILQSVGSVTVETALLALRRPVLSFLLAAGSPTVTTYKSSEVTEMLARFVRGGETRNMCLPGFCLRGLREGMRPLVSVVEYLTVGMAVANVAMQSYNLGARAIVAFLPATSWLPCLWTALAVLIHVGGTAALHLRVRVAKPAPDEGRAAAAAGGWAEWVPDELIPSAFQRPSRITWRREHVAYYALSWFLSICSIAHVVFGTLIFSSLLFFSVRDATKVVARFAASAVVCRAVVRFELGGLAEATMYAVGFARASASGDDGTAMKHGAGRGGQPSLERGAGGDGQAATGAG